MVWPSLGQNLKQIRFSSAARFLYKKIWVAADEGIYLLSFPLYSCAFIMSRSLAGQPPIPRTLETKRPSLSLTIPKSSFLQLNLGSPFTVTTPSPLSLSFAVSPKVNRIKSSLTSIFFDWEEPESAVEEEQCILIAPGEPFFEPPHWELPSPSEEYSCDFSCDALASSQKSAVQAFHEELERMIQLLSKSFVLNVECLKELDDELFISPVDVFSEMCMDSMKKSDSVQVPLLGSSWFEDSEFPDKCLILILILILMKV
ncbi:hypothetical protein C8J56DRAFT_430671 [Mycena floridula]|nr:hypothetical protein C8J56DRAFT_430671 [Mycena floridula]